MFNRPVSFAGAGVIADSCEAVNYLIDVLLL